MSFTFYIAYKTLYPWTLDSDKENSPKKTFNRDKLEETSRISRKGTSSRADRHAIGVFTE